ncbi:MAG: TniQ family protein, partial [Myxococcota bacterium]
MRAPLVLALPFIKGETLSGYVSRNAKLHETTPRDFCSDLGMRGPFLCSGRDSQVERLAWLTGEPLETLQNWRTQKIGIGRYKVGQAVASTGVLRRTAVRLCPQCVLSALSDTGPHGVFQMLEWSVLCIHTCAQHSCPLITLPSTKLSHAAYDFATHVLEHKSDVLRACQKAEELHETRFERYIRQRIWCGPNDDWLRGMDLTHIHRASLSLGAALEGIRGPVPTDLSVVEEQSLCEIGFQSLADGKEAFKAVLVDLHRASTTERPYYSADMGPFYHWMREVHTQPALAEMVQITRNHVFDTYPTPLDKDVFGAKPTHQQWLTMDDARKRSGFGSVFLKRLLGYLNGVSKHEALKRTDVHVNEVERAKTYWNTLINLKDAAAKLCILPTQVKTLQTRGVLSSIKITSSLRYLLRDEVDGLLKAMDDLPS